MAPTQARVYIISGVVQGVGYRYFAQFEARRLGVVGFAKNLPDGCVEVVGVGSKEVLDAFRRKLECGPLASRVDGVAESELEVTETFTAFTIRG